MKDLYYSKGNLDKIIELAHVILQKSETLEKRVVQDIRYYLCLALAKKKDREFLSEVKNIEGPEKDFLLGFYYRLCGRLREALDKFNMLVESRFVADRAKREIVQVYVQLEEYDKALELARMNYEGHRGNQFHSQAYFNSLVNSKNAKDEENRAILRNLISNLKEINSEQSLEMAEICQAIYFAKIDGDKVAAFDCINDCVDTYPGSYYPLFAYCDIAIKYEDIGMLDNGLSKLKSLKSQKELSSRTFNRYESYVHAFKGDYDSACRVISSDLSRYPDESKERILKGLREISNRFSK